MSAIAVHALEPDVPDPQRHREGCVRTLDYLCGVISGTVIGDDHFEVAITLFLKAAQDCGQRIGAVVGGNDNGNQHRISRAIVGAAALP